MKKLVKIGLVLAIFGILLATIAIAANGKTISSTKVPMFLLICQ